MQARVNVVDALPLMEARIDVAAAHVSAPAEARASAAAGEALKGAASPAPAATTEVTSLRGQVLQCRLIAANAGASHDSLVTSLGSRACTATDPRHVQQARCWCKALPWRWSSPRARQVAQGRQGPKRRTAWRRA